MKEKRRKLDNAALAFPAATDKNDSRVFQISCVLTEEIEEAALRKAVNAAVRHYPMFQCVLKRGNFWFYFEKTEMPPVIRKMDDTPCQALYIKEEETLLYQIIYGKCEIHLEIFHALTDGTGAIAFLCAIVREYLEIVHHIPGERYIYPSVEQQEEDSFSKYYSSEKQEKQTKKSEHAVQITEDKMRDGKMRVHEYTVSSEQLLSKAREYRASITAYLTAAFLQAIAMSLHTKQKRRPIVLMIPINLRKFYPSESMANFFGWMEIEYRFREGTSFMNVLHHVKRRFIQDLRKEQVAARMNRYVKLEKNILLRIIPLKIKDIFLKWGTKLGSKNVTGVFSNMGIIKMQESYKPYIKRFGAMASTDRIQMCSCSYEDAFYFSITSKYTEEKIENLFLQFLQKEGLEVKEIRNSSKNVL